VKEVIKQEGGESITIATDEWTSLQNTSYLYISAHFITKDWKKRELGLGMKPLATSHKSDALSGIVKVKNLLFHPSSHIFFLKEYVNDVEKGLTAVVSDSASVMDATVKKLRPIFGDVPRIPCAAHMLHNWIENTLSHSDSENISTLIEKCHTLVRINFFGSLIPQQGKILHKICKEECFLPQSTTRRKSKRFGKESAEPVIYSTSPFSYFLKFIQMEFLISHDFTVTGSTNSKSTEPIKV